MRQIRATISGSFTRHLGEIQRTVAELKLQGVRVLSPERPRIVDELDGFLFVESDRHRSVRLVQDRHLASIANSDFLWLETPDGHVGQSAALELGFAIASGIPVYSTAIPDDLTMRQYVYQVPSIKDAVKLASMRRKPSDRANAPSLLVDPLTATGEAAVALDRLHKLLTQDVSATNSESLRDSVSKERERVIRVLALPAALHV
jgi:hypothetical protein